MARSDAPPYSWKTKRGGITVSELRRLKDLEAEKAELKSFMADTILDNADQKVLQAKTF